MAGGDNGTGGNGSVYWKATHYGQNQQKRRINVKSGGTHNNDEVDFAQNDALGRDESTTVEKVGDRFEHPGFFRVTLRYGTMAEARAAVDWVAANIKEAAGGFYLTVKVPVINRKSPRDNQPLEVMVEW
jgi:hypothetical protein